MYRGRERAARSGGRNGCPVQQPSHVGVTCDVDATLALTVDDLRPPLGARSPGAEVPTPATAATVGVIYDAHHVELYAFALRTTRDQTAAEDLLQEAFVRLIAEMDAGRAPVSVRPWLYRVIGNLAVSQGRRAGVAQRRMHVLVDREPVPGPEPHLLDEERRSDLERALGELGTDARTALLMAADGFVGAEIATAIGRTASATRTLMCRARLQLRDLLSDTETTR